VKVVSISNLLTNSLVFNRRRFSLGLLILILFQPLTAKDIYFTRSGTISFFSTAIIEDIEAYNKQVTCVLDKENGSVAFQVPILGFIFENALMQEHFNENYLESEKFPTAIFKGKINDWELIELSEKDQEVNLTGEMTIHGVTNEFSEKGFISIKNNKIDGTTQFKIIVADYGIEIPKIVRNNIAKIVDVNVKLSLKKK
jgi:hypothetical protein|tara:strand:+ start:13746 stop:14342 length:597 start_codon:yes stop_codon:yes gene_type:complete